MKALKVLGSVLVSIIMCGFVLIFLTSIVLEKSIYDGFMVGITKNAVIDTILNDTKGVNYDELDKVFKDEDVEFLLDLVLNGYVEYKDNGKYKISSEDYNRIIKFFKKNADEFSRYSGETIDEEYIDKEITRDAINEELNKQYKDMSKEEEFDTVFDAYRGMVSSKTRIVLLIFILLSIGLLMLINWSYIKWMIPTGIIMIIDGIIVSLMYVLLRVLAIAISKENDGEIMMKNVSFTSVLVIGLVTIFLGIAVIVVYNIIKNKTKKEVVTPA